MTKVSIFIVDAFTPTPFGGNPAAVCLLAEDVSDDRKQKLAMEMNLSETAFVLPIDPPSGVSSDADLFRQCHRFSLRWFTPMTEVPLCGHATLASAAVLFYVMKNQQSLEFVTRSSGILTAEPVKTENGDQQLIEMRLPVNPATIKINPESNVWNLVTTIVNSGLQPEEVWLSPTTKKLLIHLPDNSRSFLESLKPDMTSLLAIDTGDAVRGVIVTTKTQDTYDFVSRYFAPWVGIPEDPVTGSAHTVLGPFWSTKLDKVRLFARQCSARGGELHIDMSLPDLTLVRGQAVIVLEGFVNL